MKTSSLKKYLIIALCALMAVSLILFAGINFPFASAADREVTISGSTIFSTSGGAQVWSHQVTEEDETSYYTMFVFTEDGNAVSYKRNLAYEWFYNVSDGEDDAAAEMGEGLFNIKIGFEEINFEKFTITFESQQYSETKDAKTSNYVIFAPAGESTVRYIVTDDADAAVPETAEEIGLDNITISFAASSQAGVYTVKINDNEAGEFTNVGGTYAKYVSSTTKPVTPLVFSAAFDGEEENGEAYMILYELNGQSFKLSSTPSGSEDTHFESGKVVDNAAPVLCLDSGVSFVGLGEEISFDYTVIDVLASSPSSTTSYFMLTKEQAADAAEFNADYYADENVYRTVTDDDNQYMIPHTTHYVPSESDLGGAFGENLTAQAAVKVAVKLTDTTATGGLSTYVLLDWYVKAEYLVTVNGYNYIAVAEDDLGAAYAYTDTTHETSVDPSEDEQWLAILQEYQEMVTAAAEGLKAGSKNYFYLPSAEMLFADNCTAYEDLTFSIYYNNGSQQSSTGKSFSALSINLTKAGTYVFTIYVTDASGNPMYYVNPDYDPETDEEEDKLIEISTGDIWSMYTEEEDSDYENTKKYLPWFSFTVEGSDIEIEEPDEQEIAYVGTTYSSVSFDINGVDYTESYELYEFDNDKYASLTGSDPLTYDEFLAMKDTILSQYRQCFTRIPALADLETNSDNYWQFVDYAWVPSSQSFVPQTSTFYLIVCTVSSSVDNRDKVTASAVVSAADRVRALAGEDTWIQDNLTSIILLCIAGASLIGIILLLVIKPKEKQDLDEIELVDSAAKAKKSKGSKSKKK